jgi:type IV pilus assembly protein PilQ
MRSPAVTFKSLGLGCLLLVTIFGSAWADVAGKITGVRLAADERTIVIDAKGDVGKHLARVIGNPNRLVLDFKNTGTAMPLPRVSVGTAGIHEIRVGETNSRTRVVVDFRDQPVPTFKIRRENDQILVILGSSLAGQAPGVLQETATRYSGKSHDSSPLMPSFVPAVAKGMAGGPAEAPSGAELNNLAVRSSRAGGTPAAGARSTTRIQNTVPQPSRVIDNPVEKLENETDMLLAQRTDESRPVSSQVAPSGARPVPSRRSGQASESVPPPGPETANRQMVREVRPPVTPPTPDPRLLVQEITELRFFQVGHNARLMIRGGDQLDYRLNKVSPTKLRLDLINAEIPKVHQKPLRTDLVSTSVEMIVPGSQTIFVQLKDAVPYQIEKQKGVLMVDFPPPRFVAERAGEREGGGGAEASRIIQEEQIRKRIESRNQDIERLQKGLEQLQKQRLEILKSYQITPDPEIFKKPVTMDFQGISLKNAFRLLAEQAGINIIVGGEVAGTTTLRLFDVPLGQVIDTILNTHGLDRVMVGNVMRVGRKAEITQFKEERRREYVQRIEEVDRRTESSRREMQQYQQEIEKHLEQLKALQEAPVDETKAEEIGEAGCIDMEGERICFQYATIRVTYVRPSALIPTLRCLFRLDCPGAFGARGVTTAVDADVTRAESLYRAGVLGREAYEERLRTEGFTPDSPGGLARLQTYDRTQAAIERSAAAIATAAGVAAPRPPTAQVAIPFGEDPKLARILAYGILWANDQDRMLFVKDTPERIAQMKKLIYTLDVPTPQVLIETRIVQASRDWSRGLGILWGGRSNQQGPYTSAHSTATEQWTRAGYWGVTGLQGGPTTNQATGQTTNGSDIPSGFVVNLPTSVANMTNLVGLGLQFGYLAGQYITELDGRIQLGEAIGKAKTISRPKVQVLDGQTASIRNGLSIPYQTVSANGTQTQMISADLSLNVTPTIYADGRIRMRVLVTNNEPEIVTGAPAPAIRTREAQTNMIVKDGDTAVIGGILQNTDSQSRSGLPGLMNVPPLSYIFSNRGMTRRVTELLVFLTPAIIRRPPPAS